MQPQLMKSRGTPGSSIAQFTFLEFFAGGGMARAGLGQRWECVFANDLDQKKADAYIRNWGDDHLHVGNVEQVKLSQLPISMRADLAWASFPCQDLSLAGNQAGLNGKRSGAFWGFWSLISQLQRLDKHPNCVVLENVCGTVSSNGGRDFETLLDALRDGGYRAGALVIDAVHFVPHSRPRLFIVAVRNELSIPSKLLLNSPLLHWTPVGLSAALREMNSLSRRDWVSWRLPLPPQRRVIFADLIENDPSEVEWHTFEQTTRLLNMMSVANKNKVKLAQLSGRQMVGTLYKRTRVGNDGVRQQRAEVRFDDIAGCLRTPGGGSSRQTILIVDGKRVRSRLLAPREAARLMGLHESYVLPTNYNDAYKLAGDGVVVPVVRHLAEYLLEPLLRCEAHSRIHVA